MPFIAVYITHASEDAARSLTDVLIEERLIACANIFPISSTYWWQGVIQNEGEFVSIVKTVPQNWSALQRRVTALHPYDVPCIMKVNVEANKAYENWIKDSVKEN
jgi:periplasmic divalent cation tolerance protein